MKKFYVITLLLFVITNLFSKSYKINQIEFIIDGKTKQQNILKNVPIDTNTIYTTEEDLLKYIEDCKTKLSNLRIFEEIKISHTENEQNENQTFVDLIIELKESFSFLAIPYFKYDSNTGTVVKVKAKDTNFLGTLNPMNFDVNFQIKKEDDFSPNKYLLGSNFTFDFPFSLGIIQSTLINDYTISYTFGDDLPEWNGLLGLKFNLPLSKLDLSLELKQYAVRDTTYIQYNDEIHFTEFAKFSVPITLLKTQRMSKVIYTPYTSFTYNWDKNGININNTDLSSPLLAIGHEFNLGQVNWNGNFRKGLSLQINNSISYNFQRNEFVPYINLEFNGHWYFTNSENWFLKRLGINTKLYTFLYIPLKNQNYYYGEQYGGFLRGIRDEQYFSSDITEFAGTKALSSFTAFTLCIDFPTKLFTTNFTKSFFRYFNFELQIAPFMDISLGYNRYTKRYFHPADGFYTAGMEILVYPQKWSSFTVRGSLGIDMGRFLNIVDKTWRANASLYEFSFGIGLHY